MEVENALDSMDSSQMDGQVSRPTEGYDAIYEICRMLPSFSCLSDQDLLGAIKVSIDTYHAELEQFDEGLPHHLYRGAKATWLQFTCITVHVCNLANGFRLTPTEAAGMMRHVDLLYRVDDSMETLIDAYGVHDISAARKAITHCFQPYIRTSMVEDDNQQEFSRVDSPVEGLSPIARPIELEQDLNATLEIMHISPISEASPQDRHWYSLELYDFFLAQLEQLEYPQPNPRASTDLYKWVANIGARSVGTKYMFAGFSCMISASRDQGRSWPSDLEMYFAQQFAQHVSVEFRLLNDIGGRVRDERKGTVSSCSLIRCGDYAELETIAAYEGECSQNLIQKISEIPASERQLGETNETRRLLEFWRMTVRLSGELYMANDPTRVPV
ncbi:hypothetical protein Q7P37_009652 [Cladosporium fusiforme]